MKFNIKEILKMEYTVCDDMSKVYDAPLCEILHMEVESVILNGSNIVIGPEPEYPD